MNSGDDRPVWPRLAGTGLLVLVLVTIGVAIGAMLWPRVVTVEQRVAAPIRQAAAARASFAEALPPLVDAVCPAIVSIQLPLSAPTPVKTSHKARSRPAPSFDGLDGIFVSADGYIVTSAHGLPPGDHVTVRLDDGRTLGADVKGRDPATGLALLKVAGNGFATLAFNDSDMPPLGTAGFVPQMAMGQGCTIQSGIVSSDFVAERVGGRSFVRLRPKLDPAVEGAPLLNGAGDVIGIATVAPGSEAPDPASFLSGPIASRATSDLLRDGTGPVTPFGILAGNLTPTLARRLGTDRRGGAVVSLVVPKSPADDAGLRAGDVILSSGGSAISGASELGRALDTSADSITLDIARGVETFTTVIHRGAAK